YTRIGLPLAGRLLSASWGTVGDFLGPSIEQFYAAHRQAELECYWRAVGLEHIRGHANGLLCSQARRVARLLDTRAPAVYSLAPVVRFARGGAGSGSRSAHRGWSFG